MIERVLSLVYLVASYRFAKGQRQSVNKNWSEGECLLPFPFVVFALSLISGAAIWLLLGQGQSLPIARAVKLSLFGTKGNWIVFINGGKIGDQISSPRNEGIKGTSSHLVLHFICYDVLTCAATSSPPQSVVDGIPHQSWSWLLVSISLPFPPHHFHKHST